VCEPLLSYRRVQDAKAFEQYPMNSPYYQTKEILSSISGPNADVCLKILSDNLHLFETVQGSTHNHQAWVGGYIDHVTEVLNIAALLYTTMNESRPLPFTLSDALLVLFLHDLEKPWKYEVGPDGQLRHRSGQETKAQHHEFRVQKLQEYGVVLTEDQLNALKYVEGELTDYSNRERKMGPLGAFCHMCDVASSRIWFDYPKGESHDDWKSEWEKAPRRRTT
jgi:hypothetical protein